MINLTVGKNSILDYIEFFNNEGLEESESGICIEFDDNDNAMALDDEDWSRFMASNNAEFIEVKNNAYCYKCGYKRLSIPIASVSEDECDVYLDINNVLVSYI